jgi:hypothetical protein
MSMKLGVEAVRKLAFMGYRFTVTGDTIKGIYEGQGEPDPHQVQPLLELVRRHKAAVRDFLRCYCPKCGGVVFVGDLCFLCDWLPHGKGQAQGPEGKPAQTCGDCTHFLPSRLNPSQGFGKCGLAHLSKRPGAYPGKDACPHLEAAVGESTLRLTQ